MFICWYNLTICSFYSISSRLRGTGHSPVIAQFGYMAHLWAVSSDTQAFFWISFLSAMVAWWHSVGTRCLAVGSRLGHSHLRVKIGTDSYRQQHIGFVVYRYQASVQWAFWPGRTCSTPSAFHIFRYRRSDDGCHH